MIVITDKDSGEVVIRPIEDVQMIMVDNHSVRITIPLITKLVKHNVGIVFCDEKHMPTSMMMDLDSNTLQSKRFQHQLSATVPMKKQIWKQIVEAKIRNQSLLLEKQGKGKGVLAQYYNNVKSGDSTNREAMAAKVYWKMLMGKDFVRDRWGHAPNPMLNYGYTILRAMVARSLMNAGLLPSIGVFHRNCYNAYPLADDIMEPYRPYVDQKVKELFVNGVKDICHEAKKAFLELFYSEIPANAMMLSSSTLASVYEGTDKTIVFPHIE
jgi:CRISPR-associated protein Cas1